MENLKKALQSPFKKGIIRGMLNSKGYFKCFLDNVYDNHMCDNHQEMFNHGSGKELHSKARAVHSSSMLGYNFFSWIDEQHPFVFNDVTYTKVYFEVQLRPLRINTYPANMDIVLEGDKNGKRVLLFIESKFLEYTENHKILEMPISYTNSKKYNDGCNWVELADKIKEEFVDSGQYNEGVKQSFCHLVALDALNSKKALAWFNENNEHLKLHIEDIELVDILFANAIFCPQKNFDEECKMYDNYETLYRKHFMTLLVKELHSDSIHPQWFNYSQIWDVMKTQINDPKRIEYIQNRYMDFAKK